MKLLFVSVGILWPLAPNITHSSKSNISSIESKIVNSVLTILIVFGFKIELLRRFRETYFVGPIAHNVYV